MNSEDQLNDLEILCNSEDIPCNSEEYDCCGRRIIKKEDEEE